MVQVFGVRVSSEVGDDSPHLCVKLEDRDVEASVVAPVPIELSPLARDDRLYEVGFPLGSASVVSVPSEP